MELHITAEEAVFCPVQLPFRFAFGAYKAFFADDYTYLAKEFEKLGAVFRLFD